MSSMIEKLKTKITLQFSEIESNTITNPPTPFAKGEKERQAFLLPMFLSNMYGKCYYSTFSAVKRFSFDKPFIRFYHVAHFLLAFAKLQAPTLKLQQQRAEQGLVKDDTGGVMVNPFTIKYFNLKSATMGNWTCSANSAPLRPCDSKELLSNGKGYHGKISSFPVFLTKNSLTTII